MTDAEIIDWLEDFVNAHGALVLHDGNADVGKYYGLALRIGTMRRTLRQAVANAAGEVPHVHRLQEIRQRVDAGLFAHAPADLKWLIRELRQARTDIGILLEELRAIRERARRCLDAEDASLVAQIKEHWRPKC